MGVMPKKTPITSTTIREHLLARATAFSTARNMSFSAMSKEAVKDDRFLARAASGSNFTLKTYQQFMDWLDAQERAAA